MIKDNCYGACSAFYVQYRSAPLYNCTNVFKGLKLPDLDRYVKLSGLLPLIVFRKSAATQTDILRRQRTCLWAEILSCQNLAIGHYCWICVLRQPQHWNLRQWIGKTPASSHNQFHSLRDVRAVGWSKEAKDTCLNVETTQSWHQTQIACLHGTLLWFEMVSFAYNRQP